MFAHRRAEASPTDAPRINPLDPLAAAAEEVDPATFATLKADYVGDKLVITTITLTILTLIMVSSRIYGRAKVLRILGPDDYCVVVATVCLFVLLCPL